MQICACALLLYLYLYLYIVYDQRQAHVCKSYLKWTREAGVRLDIRDSYLRTLFSRVVQHYYIDLVLRLGPH